MDTSKSSALGVMVLILSCLPEITGSIHPGNEALFSPNIRNTRRTESYISWSECLNNTEECFVSDSIVLLSPGNHSAWKQENERQTTYVIQDVHNFNITSPEAAATITCDANVSFAFINVTDLTIFGVRFVRCGATLPTEFKDAVLERAFFFFAVSDHLSAALLFLGTYNLAIDNTIVNNSRGLGLLAINALGKTTLTSFHCQTPVMENRSGRSSHDTMSEEGVAFIFTDIMDGAWGAPGQCENLSMIHSLVVSASVFSHGISLVQDTLNSNIDDAHQKLTIGAGMSIIQTQSSYVLFVELSEVTSFGNRAHSGANLLILTYVVVRWSSVNIQSSNFSLGNTFVDVHDKNGGGMLYAYGLAVPELATFACMRRPQDNMSVSLVINDTEFHDNNAERGAGAYIDLYLTERLACCHLVSIHRCRFFRNSAIVGSALMVSEGALLYIIGRIPYFIKVTKCTFRDNQRLTTLAELAHHVDLIDGSAIALEAVQVITFDNSTITGNRVLGIFSVLSNVLFRGKNTISYNSGSKFGGAIAMYLSSMLVLLKGTELEIVGNNALSGGGGIYVSSSAIFHLRYLCFYQILLNASTVSEDPPLDLVDAKVYMRNNTAQVSGGEIYGGNIDDCYQLFLETGAVENFRHVFDIDVDLGDPSQTGVSSDALGPCFCQPNQTPDCDLEQLNITVFPGEKFNVLVVGVGQFNGPVPSIIIDKVYPDGQLDTTQSPADPLLLEHATHLDNHCENITLHVFAKENATILLYAYKSFTNQYFTRKIQVSISECPLGFLPQNSPMPSCICETKFEHNCNLERGTISRSGTVWVGYFAESTLHHSYCPFDYCKRGRIELRLNDSDKQCAFHRRGILCGSCKEGFSVTLGTSNCKKCPNSYLALIAPFAAAGLLLVFVLCLCNITIAAGTISGFIFYANIVRINGTVFFPAGETESPLWVLIAWVNLDLGIETCFYESMDGYGKTWLQYAFPLYIWVIVLLVIVAGRYSLPQKAVGSNAVPVLATLFLLSYAKLQRTIITSLSCTWLEYDDHSSLVWLYDGNIRCFQGKHLYLSFAAIAIILLFTLPMMSVLLFTRQLQACSNRVFFRWMNNLKPLLDAYQGPYKDKYRSWLGFVLLVQNLLFLCFGLNMEGSPKVNCLVIAVAVIALLWVWGQSNGVYQSWPKNIVESFFLMNLGILAVVSLYVRVKEDYDPTKQRAVSSVLVGAALIVFFLIVCFHVFKRIVAIPRMRRAFKRVAKSFLRLTPFRCCQKVSKLFDDEENMDVPGGENRDPFVHPHDVELVIVNNPSATSSAQTFSARPEVELREPLLEHMQP